MKQYVIKASTIIHSTHQLSLLQRQIWNIFLAHAYSSLHTQTTHALSMTELFAYLAISTHNHAHITKQIKSLMYVTGWTLIHKSGDHHVRKRFSLIKTIRVQSGIIYYSFGETLCTLCTTIPYAKISLPMQQKFSSKHSLALYERCVDYKGVGRTPALSVDDFRNYMGLVDGEYPQFKLLNAKVIKKAVHEINQKSDITVRAYLEIKHAIRSIYFTVRAKK